MSHDHGCTCDAEAQIVIDVYGCDAGRDCAEATDEQRAEFELEIAARITVLRGTPREDT